MDKSLHRQLQRRYALQKPGMSEICRSFKASAIVMLNLVLK